MAKLVSLEFGKLLAVTDLEGELRENDWRDDHLGEGLILILESENKYPGQKFIKFFKNEPHSFFQKKLSTTVGIMEESESALVLKSRNSIYCFSKKHSIPEEEQKMLMLYLHMRYGIGRRD